MISSADLGAEITAAGLLIGLLTPGSQAGTVEVDVTWFEDPITKLKASGTRLNDLVALLDAFLGPASPVGPPVFTDARWYAIPGLSSAPPTVFQIVATDKADTSGEIGLGVLNTDNFGQVSATAYAYVPLFSYSPESIDLILTSDKHACQVGVRLTAPTPFVVDPGTAQETSFTAVSISGSIFLDPNAYTTQPLPSFVEVTFEDLKNQKGPIQPNTFTTLKSLLNTDVEAWLLQVVIQSSAWLATYLGNSGFTLGDVLEAAALLSRNYLFVDGNIKDPAALTRRLTDSNADPLSVWLLGQLPAADQAVLKNPASTPAERTAALVDGFNVVIQAGSSIYEAKRFAGLELAPQTIILLSLNPAGPALVRLNRMLLGDVYMAQILPNPYALNLANLTGSAEDIALNILFGALNTLSLLGIPLIRLPGGGIYVEARTNADKSQDLGLRLVLDLALNPSTDPKSTTPVVNLCLGTWLTGETDGNNWMERSGGKAPAYDPGASVLLLHRDTSNNVSFQPSFALVSIGFNLTGGGGKPLVNLNGYSFAGTDLRMFLFPGDPISAPSEWAFGFAIRLDDLAFPLAPTTGTGDGGNPVAKNFLSAGSSEPGSGPGNDSQSINPAFSVAVAWRSDSTLSPKFNLQLFGSDGSPTSTVWIPIQRSFGPVSCQRIGVQCDTSGPKLFVLFDGDVALGQLEVDLVALSIGIPLSTPLQFDDYSLGLKGLTVSYVSGPLSILGGLIEDTSATPTEYNGELLIQAAAWSISAIGSYASFNGSPSLFVFARLSATIGGPPFFFVTGLCAGFGYNRSLQLPDQDQVPDFPLLAGVSDPAKIGGKNPTPGEALSKLSQWIAPAQGVNWFAAGVQFTSFELVQSNVVLAVVVTGDFELAILGLSRVKLPQIGSFQFAYVELAIEIILHPSAGFFGVSAIITKNSYVLDPACHLTGGFAFYLWFAAPKDGGADHSGDFVLTLGGYHPLFQKPSWYPIESRLGFTWQVSDIITIQGGSYFALTPSCVMGGGALDLEFHLGDLRAWFTAQADFLFHWKPFYFRGDIGVSIGASYKLNLGFVSFTASVELGASLTIQGPPVAGRVTIDWFIISFSIPFGPDSSKPNTTIDWANFSQLLPQNDAAQTHDSMAAPMAALGMKAAVPSDGLPLTNVCKIVVGGGLAGSVPDPTSQSGLRWLVRSDTFRFSVQTAFPLTEADFSISSSTTEELYPQAGDPSPSVAVRPMAIPRNDMSSLLVLSMYDSATDPAKRVYEDFHEWSYIANLGSVPAALWGDPETDSQPAAPSSTTLPGALMGLNDISPLPPALTGPPEIPLINLAYDPIDQTSSQFLPLSASETPAVQAVTVDPKALDRIAATVADGTVEGIRSQIFAALAAFGYSAGTDGSTEELKTQVNLSYPDAPLLGAPWRDQ